MVTDETVDGGLLAGGAVLLALVAVGISVLRDGGRRVINIPSNFGQSSSNDFGETGNSRVTQPAGETGPDSPQGDYSPQSPDDNPQNSNFDYDFGGPVSSPQPEDDPDDWTPDDAQNDPTETRSVDGSDEVWNSPHVSDPTPDSGSSSTSSDSGLDHLAGSTDEWVGRTTSGWL